LGFSIEGKSTESEVPNAARYRRIRFGWGTIVLVLSLACLSPAQQPDIQNLVTSGNLEGMRWPNFSDYRDWLQKFYKPTGFAPAWVQGTQVVPQALSLIELFRVAGRKGSTRRITTLRGGRRESAHYKARQVARPLRRLTWR